MHIIQACVDPDRYDVKFNTGHWMLQMFINNDKSTFSYSHGL